MAEVKCVYDELVEVGRLVPHPNNPNKHPLKQIRALAKIIEFQGWRVPVTVSNRSGFVIRGHGRLEAAKLLKEAKFPVDYQDYASEAEEWADMVADNEIADLAEMDKKTLKELTAKLKEADFDLDLTGIMQEEIEALLKEAGKEEKPEVEFTEELMEAHNYVVLYFDNTVDWLQAQTLFQLKTKKALSSRQGYEKAGIGRVLNGARAIEGLKKAWRVKE